METIMIMLKPIKNIRTTEYSGKVYNLELRSNTKSTEKEDQYFIDAYSGLITHNCFPKDINGLIAHAQSLGIQTPLLKAVWKRNVLVDRPERDWEQLKGRAVVEETT